MSTDIFITMVSSLHQICRQGFYVAIISTNVETAKPEDELKIGLDILGEVKEKFIKVDLLLYSLIFRSQKYTKAPMIALITYSSLLPSSRRPTSSRRLRKY